MKLIKNPLLIILLAVAIIQLTGCKIFKPEIQTITKDSIVYKEKLVFKDTIITVPGDTIRLDIPCDKDTIYVVRYTDRSSAIVQVNKGKVNVQFNCDEKDIIIAKLKSEIDSYEMLLSDSTNSKVEYVKYTPKFVLYSAYLAWLIVILAAVIIFLRLKKVL